MEFVKAMEIRKRMCEGRVCVDCPICERAEIHKCGCTEMFEEHPAEAEQILEKWDKENPVRTILDEFKENYPNAMVGNDDTPFGICPSKLGYTDSCDGGDCLKCWSQPAKEKN